MTRIGNVYEIKAVKDRLSRLQEEGLVRAWELPHEDILSRLTAAVFFVTPSAGMDPEQLCDRLNGFAGPFCSLNDDKRLSQLDWKLEFGKEDR
jgi:hypothetical protein